MINRGYKIELDPTKKQISQFKECCGIARFSWNWSLNDRIERYRSNTGIDRYTTAINQNKELTRLKNTELLWMSEYSKTIHQNETRNLEQAFQNFFKGTHGFPKFKKKGKSKDSFRLTSTIRIFAEGTHKTCKKTAKSHRCSQNCEELFTAPRIQLPGLKTIRLKEVPDLKVSTRITSATVSREGDRWFVSLTCTEELPQDDQSDEINQSDKKAEKGGIVGVDLGLLDIAITSDEKHFTNPRPLQRALRKLRKLNKELSRRTKYSNNWYRTVVKLARQYQRISNIRQNTLHELTSELVKSYRVVVIEDLNVKGMMKNRKLARVIADVGWGEFRSQLGYKCSWYESELIVAPRFFASSKLCSNCWKIKDDLKLSDRIYKCDFCGLEMDRDENAAINLKIYGYLYLKDPCVADSWTETLNACGEYVRPFDGSQVSLKLEIPDDEGSIGEA